MHIELLELNFYLPGCHSLKAKRHRMAPLKRICQSFQQIGLCESGLQDQHQQSQWSLVVIANSQAIIDQTIAHIERDLASHLDAQLLSINRERR